MKRRVTYPISEIPEGVTRCLRNSQVILNDALLLLRSRRPQGALILYTAALEEFGKALLLIRNGEEAVMDGKDTVENDYITFSWHEFRLAVAEVHRPALFKIINPDDESIQTMSGKDILEGAVIEFQFLPPELLPMMRYGNLSFEGRNDFLYVDYDTANGKWKEEPEFPEITQMVITFEVLQDEIVKLRTEYNLGQ